MFNDISFTKPQHTPLYWETCLAVTMRIQVKNKNVTLLKYN